MTAHVLHAVLAAFGAVPGAHSSQVPPVPALPISLLHQQLKQLHYLEGPL